MAKKYRVFHDETKEGGYWHGLLFVPEESRNQVIEVLEELRKVTWHKDPIGWKNVGNRKNRVTGLIEQWIQWSIGWMRTAEKGEPYYVPRIQRSRKKEYIQLEEKLGIKFAALWFEDGFKEMKCSSDYGGKVETTLGFILKYALKYFGEAERIELISIHVDGHEHYQRKLQLSNILKKIEDDHESYVINPRELKLHQGPSDPRRVGSQNYKDCQFLQLTDLLIGATRTCCGYEEKEMKHRLAKPVSMPLEASARGSKGYKNSRWYRSFIVRRAFVVDCDWKFEPLPRNPQDWAPNNQQELLFE